MQRLATFRRDPRKVLDERVRINNCFPEITEEGALQKIEITGNDHHLAGFLRDSQSSGLREIAKGAMRSVLSVIAFSPLEELDIYEGRENRKSPVPIGRFIQEGVGVCLEMAALVHILLSYQGVSSEVVAGRPNIEQRYSLPSHVWVEVVKNGKRLFVVDPSIEGVMSLDDAYAKFGMNDGRREIRYRERITEPLGTFVGDILPPVKGVDFPSETWI